MSEAEVYILAEEAFNKVVQQIKDDQWGLKLPDWFQIGRTQDRAKITLKGIINYHAYDTAWVPDTLAGKTIAEVGDKYDGDLLGDDPKGSYQDYSAKAIAAAKGADLARAAHLTYGGYPSREYLKHITSFRVFRTYDIAKLIAADTKLPPDLVEAFYEQVKPDAEAWRAMGVFGPKVEVPADADLQTKLFGLAGRKI